MKPWLYAFFLFSAASITGAEEKTGSDLKKLQGIWYPESAHLAGQPLDAAVLEMTKLILRYTNYVMVVNNDTGDQGVFKIGEDKSPKQMELIGTAGPNKGKSFPCIYKFEGDKLLICYGLDAATRPKDFKSRAGTLDCLITYRKRKHKE
ncbi:MAG: TIGR03067 domain-containing protein [Verrucomicrobiota bacterium]